jgi:maltose/moltooligosaccharide transporter
MEGETYVLPTDNAEKDGFMKLNAKRTLLVGFAFLSICSFWQIYDSIVPLILKNTFHMNDTWSGVIMALDNVLALFLLPLFGSLSDRLHTRFGRRMPFILGGTVAAALFTLILPIADRAGNLTLFLVALGLVLLAMATYRSPAVALMPDVTPKPLRSKGNAVINLMGTVGAIFSLGAIALLVPAVEKPDYFPVFLFCVLVMLLSAGILLFTVRENKLAAKMREESAAMGVSEEDPPEQTAAGNPRAMDSATKKSLIFLLSSIFLWFFGYNAVTTAFSKYANVYWGLEGGLFAYTLIVAQAAAIISYIPVGMLASRIGRKKTILGGIVLLFTAFAASLFFREFSPAILVFFAVAGVGWASINVNSYPMVVEMSRGADVGKYTGYYYTFSMAAQVVTPILSGAVLEYMGYQYLFPYGALFVALSFLTMLFVRHGDSRPARKSSRLEHFDVDD